ncbi:tellurium resistance protein TerZ [Vibrio crassostreae]|uniref:TerD family protein n=1 Tax=Vibrio TaxID=662 RepID=UPI00104DE4DE|nr:MULTISPECIES: TerD family protein [Vibrio]MCC4789139.1 TerD family protein [Vibrio splendidus]TCT98855.1 tellurium resistance protein TerZ [Vibrio crassostreae]CAK2325532.1 tellurium resistance protein TerZ [Vibrio crassostreae]CAK2822958.1 tellurium resistance protein TerZ [Vibrio crassostreae]CAK2907523.1 tellurium resistance protein TerZ [Vibrio crassostreae]
MAISLQKGQKISLEKNNGTTLKNLCVGVNWGAIEKKGFFGTKKVAVDLDASCAVFDSNKQLLDIVYFGQLTAAGIRHSGDDLTGDMDGDDGLDNEVINVSLDQVAYNADQIVFVLNSFKGQDFKTIPFASIRLYEGTESRVDSVHATYDIANDPKFAGSVSMVLGKLYKHNGNWKFAAVGDTTPDRELKGTISTVAKAYL